MIERERFGGGELLVGTSHVGWLWGSSSEGLGAEFEFVETREGYWGLRRRMRWGSAGGRLRMKRVYWFGGVCNGAGCCGLGAERGKCGGGVWASPGFCDARPQPEKTARHDRKLMKEK